MFILPSNGMAAVKGDDGIVRAPFPTGWLRSAFESTRAWLAAFLPGLVLALWQAVTGDLPGWALRAGLGLGIGGAAGFCWSSYRIWRAGQENAEANRVWAEHLIGEVAEAGIPSSGRARGCVVIHDTFPGSVDGVIVDTASGRLALIGGGLWSPCRSDDLVVGGSDRPGWSRVGLRDRPDIVAMLPSQMAERLAGTA